MTNGSWSSKIFQSKLDAIGQEVVYSVSLSDFSAEYRKVLQLDNNFALEITLLQVFVNVLVKIAVVLIIGLIFALLGSPLFVAVFVAVKCFRRKHLRRSLIILECPTIHIDREDLIIIERERRKSTDLY